MRDKDRVGITDAVIIMQEIAENLEGRELEAIRIGISATKRLEPSVKGVVVLKSNDQLFQREEHVCSDCMSFVRENDLLCWNCGKALRVF